MPKSRAFIAVAFEVDDEEQAAIIAQYINEVVQYDDLLCNHYPHTELIGIIFSNDRNPVSSQLGVTMNR